MLLDKLAFLEIAVGEYAICSAEKRNKSRSCTMIFGMLFINNDVILA